MSFLKLQEKIKAKLKENKSDKEKRMRARMLIFLGDLILISVIISGLLGLSFLAQKSF